MQCLKQECSSIEINGIIIEVEEKNIKNIHLSVYPPNGRVHISVPFGTEQEKTRLYILQKWVWLTEKRRIATSFMRQPKRAYVSGEEHFFNGNSYRLKVIREENSAPHVQIIGDYLNIYTKQNAEISDLAKQLDDWYHAELSKILKKLIVKWEKILNVKVLDWDVARMTARWGSCKSDKRKILFNLELAKKPANCIEYVVAHELAHFISNKHDTQFQQILFTHLPNWKDLRQQLNQLPLTDGSTGKGYPNGL